MHVLFFGLVSGFELELGCFSFKELKGANRSMGLIIERDLYFETKVAERIIGVAKKNPRGVI